MNCSSHSIKEDPAGNALITFQVGESTLSIVYDSASDRAEISGYPQSFNHMIHCIKERKALLQENYGRLSVHDTWLRRINRNNYNNLCAIESLMDSYRLISKA